MMLQQELYLQGQGEHFKVTSIDARNWWILTPIAKIQINIEKSLFVRKLCHLLYIKLTQS